MKHRTFVKRTVDIFFDKKEAKEISRRIKRGRSANSASEIEELFAKAVASAIPKEYSLLIDYPISYKPTPKSKTRTVYPDISIVKDNTLVGIIEFKIDLGYLPAGWSKKHKTIQKELKASRQATYKRDVGLPQSCKIALKVKRGLKTRVVVLTDHNDHNLMGKFKKDNKCYVLTTGIHPNSHKTRIDDKHKIIKKLSSNSKGWDRFMLYLSKAYK